MISHDVAATRRCRAWGARARGARLVLLTVLLVAGLAFVPAHAAGSQGHSHHASPPVTVAVLLLAAAGIVSVPSGRPGRRTAILALGLLVGCFGVESALHSVHHFSDPQSAASCPLFLASQHADGAGASPVITGNTTWTAHPSPTCDDRTVLPLQVSRSHEGRAPPALLSA